MTSVSVLAFV